MIVYHGSVCEVRIPDLAKAKGRLDFGKAFYVTSYKRQAEKWAGERLCVCSRRLLYQLIN